MARERDSGNLDSGDLYIPSKEAKVRAVMTPRLVALSPDGFFPMVNLGGWLGLPGGRVKKGESGGNLLSTGAFTTLKREMVEECGIDISPYWGNSVCLGLAEITEVDVSKGVITERLVPIFFCGIPNLTMKESVVMMNIRSHFPGPLYPDARMAIEYLKSRLAGGTGGTTEPEYLNPQGKCYFQTHPTKGYLWDRSFGTTGYF